MAVAPPIEALFSASAHKRLGRPPEFGFSVFGFSSYGDEFLGVIFEPYGVAEFGGATYGNYLNLSGVYQRRHMKIGRQTVIMKFTMPHDPGDPSVAANRTKFRSAIAAWQALTVPQREGYNQRVVGRDLSGYNLFIREFMKS